MDDRLTEQPNCDGDEFDFYMQFEWPEHIERALRRLLWISLVEAAETFQPEREHTGFLRWTMATYPETAPEVLDYIASLPDARPELLIRIAENPQTTALTLTKLSQHENPQVKVAVADNNATTIDVLLTLSRDADSSVRYSMAENPSLPAKLLQQLADDENVYVAARAARTLARRNPATIQKFPQRIARSEERKLG